jgi:hypothetical protein
MGRLAHKRDRLLLSGIDVHRNGIGARKWEDECVSGISIRQFGINVPTCGWLERGRMSFWTSH